MKNNIYIKSQKKDIQIVQSIIAGLLFFERTVTAFEASTINTVTSTGLTNLVIKVNNTIVTTPFNLVAGDILRFEFDQALINTEIVMGGTY